MKYAWIEHTRRRWPVSLSCQVLQFSPSAYHQRRRRDQTPGAGSSKRISDDALLVHIRAIHAQSKGEYGWPRVYKQLLANGLRVSKERVRKLMQRHAIKARAKRKYKPPEPNGVWSSDITCIATAEGWLYLAVVLDLFSRPVVGWSMKPHMKTDLVRTGIARGPAKASSIMALAMGCGNRGQGHGMNTLRQSPPIRLAHAQVEVLGDAARPAPWLRAHMRQRSFSGAGTGRLSGGGVPGAWLARRRCNAVRVSSTVVMGTVMAMNSATSQ